VTATFRVLTVCTGNIGRSPMAERFLRNRLDERLKVAATSFEVTSAGTMGRAGEPMEEFAAVALTEAGISACGFRGRLLNADHLSNADLILTATREHRVQAVAMQPQVVRRAFTLKEFARLTDMVNKDFVPNEPIDVVAGAHARTGLAARLRRMAGGPHSADDDVVDPLGAPLDTYRIRAAEIDLACARAVDVLLGPAH